jgi:hypothetical protein
MKKNKIKGPAPLKVNSLVKLDPTNKEWLVGYLSLFECGVNDTFIYLGDIAQMPGHGIFVGHMTNDAHAHPNFGGKVFTGYHTDAFVAVPDEEC